MRLIKNASVCMLLLGMFFSCQSESDPATNDDQEVIIQDTVKTEAPSADNPEPKTPEKNISQVIGALTMEWNIAINNKNFGLLKTFYADDVGMHGVVLTSDEFIYAKREKLMNNGQAYQQILGGVDVKVHSANVAKAEFTKKVVNKSGTRSYSSYLMFERFNNGWKIVAEGDDLNDEIAKEQNLPKINTADIISCDKAVEAVFLSAPVVQNLLKQRYAKYKLEFTPGAPDNPNHRYWFWVYANTPNSTSVETYGRFQVDAETGQVFEYKALEDKVVPVAASISYQQYIKKYCIPKAQ